MSTKSSLAYSDDFHLYAECLDNDNVYLRLDKNPIFSCQSSQGNQAGSVTLEIPVDIWRQIVQGWLDSHWGSDPSYDHKKVEFDPTYFEELMGQIKKNQEKID